MIQPSGETGIVKAIEVGNESKDWGVVGQICILHLTEVDPQHLQAGDLLCSADQPVSVVKKLVAQVVALDMLLPQGVDLHLGRLHVAGHITALITIVDAKGEVVKQKPRVVKAGQRANISIALNEGVPLGAGDRIVLRANGDTVAAGKIERVQSR